MMTDAELRDSWPDLGIVVAELRATVEVMGQAVSSALQRQDADLAKTWSYRLLVGRIRRAVERHVPAAAVASLLFHLVLRWSAMGTRSASNAHGACASSCAPAMLSP